MWLVFFVFDIVVFVVGVGEEFVEVFVVISVDAKRCYFVMYFEEGIFVGFKSVCNFDIGFVDYGVVFAGAVGDGVKVCLPSVFGHAFRRVF